MTYKWYKWKIAWTMKKLNCVLCVFIGFLYHTNIFIIDNVFLNTKLFKIQIKKSLEIHIIKLKFCFFTGRASSGGKACTLYRRETSPFWSREALPRRGRKEGRSSHPQALPSPCSSLQAHLPPQRRQTLRCFFTSRMYNNSKFKSDSSRWISNVCRFE